MKTKIVDGTPYSVHPGYGPNGSLSLLQALENHMDQMVLDPHTGRVCRAPQGEDGQPWKGGDREVYGEWVMVTWEWEPEGF